MTAVAGMPHIHASRMTLGEMNKEAVNHKVLCNEIITTQSLDTRCALRSRWLLKRADTHTHTHTHTRTHARTLQVARGVVTVAKLSQGNELALVFRVSTEASPPSQEMKVRSP